MFNLRVIDSRKKYDQLHALIKLQDLTERINTQKHLELPSPVFPLYKCPSIWLSVSSEFYKRNEKTLYEIKKFYPGRKYNFLLDPLCIDNIPYKETSRYGYMSGEFFFLEGEKTVPRNILQDFVHKIRLDIGIVNCWRNSDNNFTFSISTVWNFLRSYTILEPQKYECQVVFMQKIFEDVLEEKILKNNITANMGKVIDFFTGTYTFGPRMTDKCFGILITMPFTSLLSKQIESLFRFHGIEESILYFDLSPQPECAKVFPYDLVIVPNNNELGKKYPVLYEEIKKTAKEVIEVSYDVSLADFLEEINKKIPTFPRFTHNDIVFSLQEARIEALLEEREDTVEYLDY